MLNNFQLAAIVREGSRVRLLSVPLHRAVQQRLALSWHEQYQHFVAGKQEIDFDPGYKPEDHEIFALQGFELPEWLDGESSISAPDLDSLGRDDAVIDLIQGVIGFARTEEDEEIFLFQNFSRSHVIRPGNFLLLQGDVYATADRPGITLERRLSAVYMPDDDKLLFSNFRTVNTFLPLADFYRDASEEQIREILGHDRLLAEDPDALANDANQWFRKRFAMLDDSGVLDNYPARVIQEKSAGYDVDVRVDGDRIVFPAEKAAAKKLLQFLNEELFRGAITETLFETNSKREAD